MTDMPKKTLWVAEPVILASRSRGRAQILANVGIPFSVRISDVDERAIEGSFVGPPPELARELAVAKARAVSLLCPQSLVLGGDQVLALDDTILHKAASRDDAIDKLRRLGGRSHSLHSAIAVVRNGKTEFSTVATATVTMASLSTSALVAYCDAAGDDILASVGSYEIEGLGANLIEKIDGDFFTVVGLPLLPLLAWGRQAGMISGWKGVA